MDSFTYFTNCGHTAFVKPVQSSSSGGSGHRWICKISGSKAGGGGGSGPFTTMYTPPAESAAKEMIARHLKIPVSALRKEPKAASSTISRRRGTRRTSTYSSRASSSSCDHRSRPRAATAGGNLMGARARLDETMRRMDGEHIPKKRKSVRSRKGPSKAQRSGAVPLSRRQAASMACVSKRRRRAGDNSFAHVTAAAGEDVLADATRLSVRGVARGEVSAGVATGEPIDGVRRRPAFRRTAANEPQSGVPTSQSVRGAAITRRQCSRGAEPVEYRSGVTTRQSARSVSSFGSDVASTTTQPANAVAPVVALGQLNPGISTGENGAPAACESVSSETTSQSIRGVVPGELGHGVANRQSLRGIAPIGSRQGVTTRQSVGGAIESNLVQNTAPQLQGISPGVSPGESGSGVPVGRFDQRQLVHGAAGGQSIQRPPSHLSGALSNSITSEINNLNRTEQPGDALTQALDSELERLRAEVTDRMPLKKRLSDLRDDFAEKYGRSRLTIFSDAALDDIVLRLPKTNEELLNCHGICLNQSENYGKAILRLVAVFREGNASDGGAALSRSRQRSRSSSTSRDTNEDEEKEEAAVEETLTVEQIVEQKLKDAEKRGEVILIDEDVNNRLKTEVIVID